MDHNILLYHIYGLFILECIALMNLADDVDKYDYTPTTIVGEFVLWYCITVNFCVWFMCFAASAYCIGKSCSKWGNFCCNLFIVKWVELLLVLASFSSIIIVGIITVSVIANSMTVASFHSVCLYRDAGGTNAVTGVSKYMAEDDIFDMVMTIKEISTGDQDEFCSVIDDNHDTLSGEWIATFFAVVAHLILTISAVRNYLITRAIYASTVEGADLDTQVKENR
eukprot:UN30260